MTKIKLVLIFLILTIIASFFPIHSFATWEKDNNGNYKYSESGRYITGWKSINGNQYYFKKDTKMATGLIGISGVCHYFGDDGIYKGIYTGWATSKAEDKKFYYQDGIKQIGWVQIDNYWYYFMKDYSLNVKDLLINDELYIFYSDGRWSRNTSDNDTNDIIEYVKKYFDKNIYLNVENKNGIIIISTTNTVYARNEIKSNFKAGHIIYREVEYSLNNLEKSKKSFSDKFNQLIINSQLNYETSRVDVWVTQVTDDMLNFVKDNPSLNIMNLIYIGNVNDAMMLSKLLSPLMSHFNIVGLSSGKEGYCHVIITNEKSKEELLYFLNILKIDSKLHDINIGSVNPG